MFLAPQSANGGEKVLASRVEKFYKEISYYKFRKVFKLIMPTSAYKPEIHEATPPGQEAPAGARNVIWDDSQMTTAYVNVCNVLGTREEITILFGTNQAWPSQKDVKVSLSNRIVLNPYAAKRLLLLLQQGLKEYETRFGEL